MGSKQIAIAIDGPAAAGKSTVARKVARSLTYLYIDTGAMYRALTFKALKHNIDLEDVPSLSELLAHTSIELVQGQKEQHVMLDEKDVSYAIRSAEVTNNVSYIAKHAIIRQEMVKRQQELASKRGVVMDGRDIGTHVIPDAEVKIFLNASVEERAKRRYEENIQKGFAADLDLLIKEIKQRDLIDSEREAAPLIKAEDAIEVDTTNQTINEVADFILKQAKKAIFEQGEMK